MWRALCMVDKAAGNGVVRPFDIATGRPFLRAPFFVGARLGDARPAAFH